MTEPPAQPSPPVGPPSAPLDAAVEIGSAPLARMGLILGPLLALAWLAIPAAWIGPPADYPAEAHRLMGVLILIGVWWLTEPIPIPATGLLGVVLCVFLRVVPAERLPPKTSVEQLLLARFSDTSVYFLLGGLFIGLAMSRHGLDRRFALFILTRRWAGRRPEAVLAALGLAVMLISMWTSNTAATAMIYPVAMGVIAVLGRASPGLARGRFATAILLMVAFASGAGGVATPIGTPTNLVARGMLRAEGVEIPFFEWLQVGLPLSVLLYCGLFLWMSQWRAPAGLDLPSLRSSLAQERASLGRLGRGEINTLVTFLVVVALWITPGVLAIALPQGTDNQLYKQYTAYLPESTVALLAPILLFLLPVNFTQRRFTLEPEDFTRIDWGTILLYGSGLALGTAMFESGLAERIGRLALRASGTESVWAVTALAIVAGICISNITSNVAAANMLVPVIIKLCQEAQMNAIYPVMGACLACSFGSCLPVSTPPNAIVYGSRLIPLRRMILGGLGMDLMAGTGIWIVLRLAGQFGWKSGVL